MITIIDYLKERPLVIRFALLAVGLFVFIVSIAVDTIPRAHLDGTTPPWLLVDFWHCLMHCVDFCRSLVLICRS